MNLDLLVVVFYFLVIGAVGWMGIRRANSKEAYLVCLLYTSPSPRDVEESRMPSSA